ncbi:MAG TPA: YfhO family protein [Candidatus Eisenbacteria bacterium]|nr:YfhO family protein [Candidatus Eisenbacteria bacterium]
MAEKKPRPRKSPPARPPVTLSTGWAAAVLGLLVVIFFHQLVVGGKTFVSPDAIAPAGFVRVGEQMLYKEHVYPLWNPFVFLGMPSFASGAYNPLIYPPDWPVALVQKILPFLPDMTWMLIYYVAAGLGVFLLAREWGASAEGALLGAVAFVFAPNLVAVGSHGHGSQLVNSAWLPIMLWLAARWMRAGGLAELGGLALAGGFQMLRGHAQIAFYTWLAIGILAGVEVVVALLRPASASAPLPAKLVRAGGILAAMLLAFGIAGFYNLPLRDYARWSIRGGGEGGGVGIGYATQWSMGPWELPAIVAPWAVGFGGQTYWGGMPFTDYPNAYMGMVAVLLALFAVLDNGAPRIFAALLALVALTISFGSHFPLYQLLYDHLPLFNKFRVPVMIILLFQLAIALGAAWGASRVLAERPPGSQRPLTGRLMIGAAVALGVMLLLGVAGQDAWRESYVRSAMAHHPDYPRDAALFAQARYATDLARAAFLGLGALALLWLARAGKLSASVAAAGVLVLLLIELWPVSGQVMAPVIGERRAASLDAGRDDVVQFLEQAGPVGSFRIYPVEEFQSNRFAGFAIASVGGAHAAKPKLIQDYLEKPALAVNPHWLRLLNVRFLVTRQAVDSAQVAAAGLPGMRPVFQGSGGTVLEMPDWLPRATVVGQSRVVSPARAILDSVAAGSADASRVTYLEQDQGLALGPVEGAKATIARYRLNDVSVDVETPAPGLLRLADLWYPDWTATVDGKPERILKADYLLRAVPVPAGRHRVEFRFQSAAMRTGLMLSIASLAATLALLVFGLLRRRRPPAPAAGAA